MARPRTAKRRTAEMPRHTKSQPDNEGDVVAAGTSHLSSPRTQAGSFNFAPVGRWVMPLAIVVVVFLCYAGTLHNEFLDWDDQLTLPDNPHYRGLSLSHLRWMFTTTLVWQYRPLTWVTYGADYLVWGLNPEGYFLTNILIHAGTAVAFYFLLRMLLPVSTERVRAAAAAAGALFFAVHPLRVEAVAWISERQEPLCGLFFVLATIAYVRMAATQRSGRRGTFWLITSLIAFALSLLAKPAGVMLPAVLLVLDVYPLRRYGRAPDAGPTLIHLIVEKVPYVALSAGAALLAIHAKEPEAMPTLGQHGVVQRALQATYGLAFYVQKTIVPFGLNPLYLLPRPLNPLEPRFVVSAIAVVALAALLIRFRRRLPWAAAAALCYILIALPVLGFVQNGNQIVADRYSYLACLPWAVLFAAGVRQLLVDERIQEQPARRYAALLLVAAILVGLSARTVDQTHIWRNSLTLWDHSLQLDPLNSIAYTNRGPAREDAGDLDGALSDYDKALRLNPRSAEAHSNRGRVLQAKGDLDAALAEYNVSLRLNPRNANALTSRGFIKQSKGDLTGAVADFNEALQVNPDHAEAHNNRGVVRQAMGDLDGALDDLNHALTIKPSYANAYSNRGSVRQARGDSAGAIADFTEALRVDPQHTGAYYNRGNARKAKGDLAGAIADYDQVIRLNPRQASAYSNRGNARTALGDLTGALADYDAALALNPQHANAYNNRASVRQAAGDLEGAIADYTQALQLLPPDAAARATYERNLANARSQLAKQQAAP